MTQLTPAEAREILAQNGIQPVAGNSLSPEEARSILASNGIEVPKKASNRTLGGEVARGLATGAASLADPLAFIANAPTYAANAFGYPGEAPVHYPSGLVKEGLERLSGVEGEPTTGQKVAGTAASFIGTGAGSKLATLGKEALVKMSPKFAPRVANQVSLTEKLAPKSMGDYAKLGGAGLGAGVGEEVSDNPIIKTLGGISGATIGGGLTHSLMELQNIKRNIPEGISKAVKFNPRKYEQFQEAGISPSLGEVTDSKAVKSVQNLFSELPGSANIMEKFGQARASELEKATEKSINASAIHEKEGAGELVKKGAKAYNSRAKNIASRIYDKAFSRFSEKTEVPMQNTNKAINETLKAITPEAKAILDNSPSGKRIREFQDAIKNHDGKLPYHDLKKSFKPFISDLIDSWGQVGDADQGRLKNIADNITKDMSTHIEKIDPKASRYLKKADKFWADFSTKNRFITNNIIGHKDPITSYNTVFNNLKRGNVRPANIMFKGLDKAEKEGLSTTFIDELGLNKEKDFNLETFSRNFNKLKPTSKYAVLGGMPEDQAKKIRSIAEAMKHTEGLKLQGNPSRTAYLMAMWQIITNVTTATPGLATSYLGAKKFTDPKFLDMLYKVSKNNPTANKNNYDHYKTILTADVKNLKQKEEDKD